MMARSAASSNQRPDTLMQDRSPPARPDLLQRTTGQYIRVKPGGGPLRRSTSAQMSGRGPVAPYSATRRSRHVFSRARFGTQVAATVIRARNQLHSFAGSGLGARRAETRLIKPARRGAGFALIPVLKIDVPRHIARAVRERPCRGGSGRAGAGAAANWG
jgi:hypothetical protein